MTEQFPTDLAHVNWGATAKLTLARGFAASVVWSVIGLLSKAPPAAMPALFVQMLLAATIGAPLYHLLIRAVRVVLGGLPLVKLVCDIILFATSLAVAIGDPIVFAINRSAPHLLGITDFKPFNLVPAIFVHE